MMGRPPKPTALKLLAGNPGKRPLNDAEPVFPTDIDTPPSWLNLAAKREWCRLLPHLLAQGLFTVADLAEFADYCLAWAEVQELTRYLRRHGRSWEKYVFVEGVKYLVGVKPRPEVVMLAQAKAQVHLFGASFGLSPSARTRIKGKPPEEVDPMELLLNKKG